MIDPKATDRWNAYVTFLRLQELSLAFEPCRPGTDPGQSFRVVEIGGGSGFQAREISKRGAEVVSFDPAPTSPSVYPVTIAFGHELPVSGAWADMVFSSNVFEHLPEPYLTATLNEAMRITKPTGTVVIILPTSAMMVFTMLLQPVGHLKQCFFSLLKLLKDKGAVVRDYNPVRAGHNQLQPQTEGFITRLLKMLTIRFFIAPPHGVGKSSIHEVWSWRKRQWVRVFTRSGFEVQDIQTLQLAGSLHQLTGFSTMPLRKLFGKLGLGMTHLFHLRIPGTANLHRKAHDEN
jgi:SAM-dependent methyltransferase